MNSVQDIRVNGGRTVRVYDTGPDATADPGATSGTATLFWHHGSPQTGALLTPLLDAAAARDIRLISYARPSYGGSGPVPGRDVASAAGDVAQIADALGVEQFSVMGASGGGPHALACAALLPDRVVGAVCLAGIAPLTTDFDWFAGMASDGGLRAAMAGRPARARYAETDEFDDDSFISADWAALAGDWSSLGADAQAADADGPDGLIDDDVAFVSSWGFELKDIAVPVLVAQGGLDRVVPAAHADWLVRNCRHPELWLRPNSGHISILEASPLAMDWLRAL